MTTSRRRRAFAAALAVVGALAALPAAAPAARNQESIIEDELLMLHSGTEARAAALDDAVALGADTIRANVQWSRYAPATTSKQRPAGFDAANPAAYPPGTWDSLADLVAGAEARGLSVLLTVTGSGPAWASRCRGSVVKLQTCRPRPGEFGQFVRAVGLQFPQVKRWSIWNEPNQPGWLSPQFARVRGAVVPVAADVYRSLARSAIAALRATGHGGDQILLGETAPVGRTTGSLARRPAAPEFFLRELFCLDARGRKLRGATAKARGCARFRRLAVTGYAHHPYGRSAATAPERARRAGRDRHPHLRAAQAGARPGGARRSHPASACRSSTRSTASRPGRPSPWASRSRGRPPTSTSPTGSRSATAGSAASRSTSSSTTRTSAASRPACAS